LNLLSWNVDLGRTAKATNPARRAQLLVDELKFRRADIDIIVLQESSEEFGHMIQGMGIFEWVEKAGAKTFHGFLHAFVSKNSKWKAEIQWQYTCLTFDLYHRDFVLKDEAHRVRVSNVLLDAMDKSQEHRERAIKYLTRVPQPDIVVGDGKFKKEESFSNYDDAFVLAGAPDHAMFTENDRENGYRHYAPNPSTTFQARHCRLYLRPRLKFEVKSMELLMPWMQDDVVKVGCSDHYGLLVKLLVYL